MTNYPPTPPLSEAQISVFCNLVEIYCPSEVKEHRQGGAIGTRGRVTDFSARSRGRMLRKIAKCRNLDTGLFITLTYPDAFPQAAVTWKRHLDTLIKRIHRMPWSTFGMWRLELKPRLSGVYEGYLAPHFHLLIFTAEAPFSPKIEVFRRWVRLAWYTIAHAGDKHGGMAGTQADHIENRRHAAFYAAKYASKVEGSFSIVGHLGRHWGVWGEWDLSISILLTIKRSQFIELKRLMRGWLNAKGTNASRSYSKRMSRAPPSKGLAVFGLGDSSNPSFENGFTATILKMLESCYQTPIGSMMVLFPG